GSDDADGSHPRLLELCPQGRLRVHVAPSDRPARAHPLAACALQANPAGAVQPQPQPQPLIGTPEETRANPILASPPQTGFVGAAVFCFSERRSLGSSGVPGGCSRRFIVSHLISVICVRRTEWPAFRHKSLLKSNLRRT